MVEIVSVVIPTRGNVDLDPITSSFPPEWEVLVYDNGQGVCRTFSGTRWGVVADGLPDLGVYARYAAIEYAAHALIMTQDDDVVLAPESFPALLDAYEAGVVTANMTEYHQLHTHDSALIGFGAVFERELPARAFERYFHLEPNDSVPLGDVFVRTCDVVFTALTPRRVINTPYTYLPWASDDNRMSRQGGFAVERQDVLDQLKEFV